MQFIIVRSIYIGEHGVELWTKVVHGIQRYRNNGMESRKGREKNKKVIPSQKKVEAVFLAHPRLPAHISPSPEERQDSPSCFGVTPFPRHVPHYYADLQRHMLYSALQVQLAPLGSIETAPTTHLPGSFKNNSPENSLNEQPLTTSGYSDAV
jgi:hypothetical protein